MLSINSVSNFRDVAIGPKMKKNLLIIREQGVGDEILYGTMYKDVLESFENTYIESDERLISLFIESFENKYTNNDIGWDLGGPTPVFKQLAKQIPKGKICILGCGNGYDAIMFSQEKFQVTAVDFAASPIKYINNKSKDLLYSLFERFPYLFDKYKAHFIP